MVRKIRLKRCPFCGGAAEVCSDLSTTMWVSENIKDCTIGVGCRGCGVVFLFTYKTNDITSKHKAIRKAAKLWNARDEKSMQS